MEIFPNSYKKVFLAIKWQKKKVELCSSVCWKAECASDELGYLT
jgi:hypothetical protein